jgi:DNA polymerase III epsilon subunit-like protein
VFGKNCRYDLDSVCHYFGIDTSIRDRFGHNALGDCILTAKVYAYYPELVSFKAKTTQVPGKQRAKATRAPVKTTASARNQPAKFTPLTIVQQTQDESWLGQAVGYLKKLFGN